MKHWSDDKSWQEFFDAYAKLIYRFAVKAGLNDAEAQDAVQETIITVAKNIQDFRYDRSVGSFKGWLLHIARWKVVDQFRKRRPGEGHPSRNSEKTTRTSTIQRIPDPAGLRLEIVWDEEWKISILEAATERVKHRVNPIHFQIFDMYVLRKWPVEKVTRALGVSDDQVYAAKSRISALLKKEIAVLERSIL